MKTKAFLASILMLPAVAMAQISRSGNVIDSDGGDANIFDHLLGEGLSSNHRWWMNMDRTL